MDKKPGYPTAPVTNAPAGYGMGHAPSAPPPYSQTPYYAPQGAPPPYTQQPQPHMMYPPAPQYPQAYQQPYPQYQQPQNVVVHGGFDSGARFDPTSQPMIPPPPPGCAPNAAQMAAAQGHNVTVTQQKASWLSGSGSGGYVWY